MRLVFDLYTRLGLSYRQIALRLNGEGLRYYGKPFTATFVAEILRNPAYVGDIYFGKKRAARFHSFNAEGTVTTAEGNGVRPVGEQIVREGTHAGLIDRTTWALAQDRRAAMAKRPARAPQDGAHYLKPILVCGHCGGGLTGHTEKHKQTGQVRRVYVCSSYADGQANGHATPCGYQSITHEEAERLLLDKVRELNLSLGEVTGAGQDNLRARLERLGHTDEAEQQRFEQWVREGVDALADYLVEQFPEAVTWPTIQQLRRLALRAYQDDTAARPEGGALHPTLALTVADLRRAVQEVEEHTVGTAREKIAALKAEHATITRVWARADERMQATLREDLDRLDGEIRALEPATVPLSVRLQDLLEAEKARQQEREKLLAEWATLEERERGEALRRLFGSVTLFWERTWHPTPAKPTRPLKTNRKGRWSYTLQKDRTQWEYCETNLGGPC